MTSTRSFVAVAGFLSIAGAFLAFGDAEPSIRENKGANALRPAWLPGLWDLRLDSLELRRDGLFDVRATLVNHGDAQVRLARWSVTSSVAHGVRLWSERVAGSYRATLRPNVSISPAPGVATVGPGETLTLHWMAGTNLENASEALFQWARSEQYLGGPDERIEDLQPGTYVVDASVSFRVWPVAGEGLGEALGTVEVFSSNKLWVTVSEPDGGDKPSPSSAPATQPAAPPDSDLRPAPASPTSKPSDHER